MWLTWVQSDRPVSEHCRGIKQDPGLGVEGKIHKKKGNFNKTRFKKRKTPEQISFKPKTRKKENNSGIGKVNATTAGDRIHGNLSTLCLHISQQSNIHPKKAPNLK